MVTVAANATETVEPPVPVQEDAVHRAPVCSAIAERAEIVAVKVPPDATVNLTADVSIGNITMSSLVTYDEPAQAVPLRAVGTPAALQYVPGGRLVWKLVDHELSALLIAT